MPAVTNAQDWAVLPYNSKKINDHYLVSNFLGNWDFLVQDEFRRRQQLSLVADENLPPTAEELLAAVAQGGPRALRGTRRILNLLEEAEILSDDALDEIGRLRHESWSGEEFILARDAFLARSAGNKAKDREGDRS